LSIDDDGQHAWHGHRPRWGPHFPVPLRSLYLELTPSPSKKQAERSIAMISPVAWFFLAPLSPTKVNSVSLHVAGRRNMPFFFTSIWLCISYTIYNTIAVERIRPSKLKMT
jgi:hypothetical protein